MKKSIFGFISACLLGFSGTAWAELNHAEHALERLSESVQIPTISGQDKGLNNQAFNQLHALFQRYYPQVYTQLSPQKIGQSLLIHWPGKKNDLKPVLLMAHLDVVPVEEGTEQDWSYPPFSGTIDADGFLWGRGTLDDKVSAMAILEGIEALLKAGFQPERSIYIALGHDEEVGGQQGAGKIADYLKSQGVQFAFALDEGLAVVPGSIVGVEKPVALVGVAEKGYVTLALEARAQGGHSSMPPKETAVGILSTALHRLSSSPMPARMTQTARQMFVSLAPEMTGFKGVALSNLWLFEPLVLGQLSESPATNALIRTTIAPTMLMGSPKENVLPIRARAVVNLRVLPGDTLEAILLHFRQVIGDSRIAIEILEASKASPESSTRSAGFELLQQTVVQVFPEATVAPSLVLAATDSRNYEALCDDMYRFLPVYLDASDLGRIHGTDERISRAAYQKVMQFYHLLLSQL